MPEQPERTNNSIVIRIIALLVFVAFVGLFYAFVWPTGPHAQAQSSSPPAQAKSTPRPAQQTIIGKDCQQCHRAIVESFALEIHGKSACAPAKRTNHWIQFPAPVRQIHVGNGEVGTAEHGNRKKQESVLAV